MNEGVNSGGNMCDSSVRGKIGVGGDTDVRCVKLEGEGMVGCTE